MLKHVVVGLVIVAAGCKGRDKCEQVFDKISNGLAKDLGHAPDKAKIVDQCREGLEKHPESEKMIDCILALSGEPRTGDMQTCMDTDDRRDVAAKQLNRLARGAKDALVKTGSFPQGKVSLSPVKECCFGYPNREKGAAMCPVDAAVWQDPTWRALGFSIDAPSIYRYGYESDGKTFTAVAVGDADCDTNMATFTLTGTIGGGAMNTELVRPPKGSY